MPQSPATSASPSHGAPLRHVFVYGTLRRGDDNDINRMRPAPEFIGLARIEGVLHHLGAYPGVRLRPGAQVVGEVYAISAAVEAQLDVLEMVAPEPTGEYAKREIAVEVAGRSLPCIVYEIGVPHSAGKPVIACGDWVLGRHG